MGGCTQDEAPEATGIPLPHDTYPLQIGRISISAEADEEPWTRVTENNTDGMRSVWQNGDKIGVRIGDHEETGIYEIKVDDAGNVTATPITPVYWTNTQSATVTAWYPATDGTVFLYNQDRKGFSYVLHGTGTGNHQTPVTLNFTHQLAKVRVVTKGTVEVLDMELFSFPAICFVTEGKITEVPSFTQDIPMRQVTYEGIGKCWEANVTPGVELKAFRITIPVDGAEGIFYSEWGSTVTPEAGKLSTIELTVNRKGTIDLSQQTATYEINDNATHYFNGKGSYGIRVTGGNPTIYLGDAHISVASGNAISIEDGNPTIHVLGDNNVSSNDGAGIYVAEGSTVTITGRNREDVLTARGGNGGSGIGGNRAACGNIEINNMTVHAYGSDEDGDYLSAGIGGSGNYGCGTITIDNATISAYGASDELAGNMSTPGIGGGLHGDEKGTYSTITIRNNSQVSVQRGSSRSDYIGSGGSTNNPANSPNGIDATVDETSTVTPLN